MALITMQEDIDLPGLASPGDYGRVVVSICPVGTDGRPVSAFELTTKKTYVGPWEFVVPNPGTYTFDLPKQVNLTPSGVVWERKIKGPNFEYLHYFNTPNVAGPANVIDNLTSVPGAITDSALSTHAASASLHGGGQELFRVASTNNQVTASTSFVDVTELIAPSIIVPNRPFVLLCYIGVMLVEELNQGGDFQIATHPGNTVLTEIQIPRIGPAGRQEQVTIMTRLPSAKYTPTPGATEQYKVRFKTSVATSDFSVFVNFGALTNDTFFMGYTV